MSTSPSPARHESPTPHAAHAMFRRAIGWRSRFRRKLTGAVRPHWIQIRGGLVLVATPRGTMTWGRGDVRFCYPRRSARSGWSGPRQCILVTPASGGTVVLDCDAFARATFIDLVRHLRNFEAIGDAAHDPWITVHLTAQLQDELLSPSLPQRTDPTR